MSIQTDYLGMALSLDELDHENLAYFKCPGYVVFCDELPKTASNKPKRADVKALARARVASGDCVDTRHLKKRRKTA